MRTEKNENDVMIVRANDAIPFNPTETHIQTKNAKRITNSLVSISVFSLVLLLTSVVCAVSESRVRPVGEMNSCDHCTIRCTEKCVRGECCVLYFVQRKWLLIMLQAMAS